MTRIFTGHIHLFHAFDVGDDINFEQIKKEQLLIRKPTPLPRYFKNYHKPFSAELPHPHTRSYEGHVRLHQFGALSLQYKVPFELTFEELREFLNTISDEFTEQSINDASTIFRSIEPAIQKPNFFHIKKSCILMHVNPAPDISVTELKETYGGQIASLLRFDDETLSEYKKNEILEKAFGYYRGDLIVIDGTSAFIYDDDYEDVVDLFEFANIQHLELQYFDKLLDKQLSTAYNREIIPLNAKELIPFWSTLNMSQTQQLSMLQVEISVITERLENTIRLSEEPYYSELYEALSSALDLKNWKESIEKKLSIIKDLSDLYENRSEVIRGDMFNTLITILIFLELLVGLSGHLG